MGFDPNLGLENRVLVAFGCQLWHTPGSSLLLGLGFGGWLGFGQVLQNLLEASPEPHGSGLGPLLFQFGPQAFCLGLGLGSDLNLSNFYETCWKPALSLKALARAPFFSNFGPKPSVWAWVWDLTWICVIFTKPVGNQP